MKKIIMMLLGVVFATGAWADTTFWKFSTGDSYLKDGYGDGSVFSRLPSTPVYCLCAEDATDTSDVTAQNALLSDLREDMIDIANSAVAMAETDDNGRVRARDGIAFDLESESICSGATAYFYEVVLSFDGKYVYISDLVSATASSSEPTAFILSSEASTNRVDKTGTADFSKAGWYALAVPSLDPIEYLTWDEESKSLVAATNKTYEVVTADTATFEDGKWYVVNSTIERAGIKVNGAAHLILCDGASLTVTGADNEAGIEVPADKSLTIYGQSEGTGELKATGGEYGAGIGGNVKGTCGTMTINGGTITATGGYLGAGIGGGSRTVNAATITINGGEIEAIGGEQGAGIGSGNYYEYVGSRSGTDTITINGGTIQATGGKWGAGIGSGSDGFAVTVTINGGSITASTVAGKGAEAIGQGDAAKAATTVTFAEGVEVSIKAGDDEASATATTVDDYTTDHSAAYVKISEPMPTVTVDEIIDGEDWTKFDVAYAIDNLKEGVDYKVIIDVTAGGVTKSITNATAIVNGSFTNTVDTVKLFGSKVFDGEAKVVLSLEADGEVISSATEKTVSILPPPVEYLTWDEETKALVAATNQAYEVVTADTATFEDGKWYVVTNNIERGTIKVNGAAHLILCDGASLTVTGVANKAGIEVPADKSLTIYGQCEGTGELKATGGKDGAGIGGNYKGTCGTITINGGKITATSSYSGAGIGGGSWCNNPATITINGGTVKATGGENGAGIGSGDYYGYGGNRTNSDIITINGGEIEANGGKFSAGIGCGSDGRAVMVTINGGKVTAIGGRKGAGIGAGDDSYTATIVVNGGKIKAIGGDNGAGIGGGDGVGVPVTITVNDGEIEAIGGQQGAGIGSGNYYQFNGSRSGTDVITINGGTIQATGGVYSAGIGSGAFGLAATVAINGGAITASTSNAEAIGSGYSAVSPTTVTFGEDMGFRIEAGVDSATAEVVSTADFAEDHSAAYASCTSFDPVNVSFPVVAGLKYTVVVDGEEYIGAISGETYTVAVPNGSTVTITYSPANSTITLGTGITNPVTLTNITEAKAFTKADLPSVSQTPISYLAWDDEKKELYTEQTTNFIYEVVTEKTKKLDDGLWYVVNTGVERGGVKVNGSAHLILCDGASLTVTGADNEAGIEVAEGRSLTIYGQENGTGKLEATGGNYGAGIGGKVNGTCGAMTINGGAITAIGGRFGAGIGGGSRNVNAVTITINGGEIEAIGGQQGAGIGSGNYYKFNGSRSGTDVITINGGTITATGGQYGAGIGSGSDGLAATVTINGGTITASTVPGQGAEAIGNGGDAVAATTVTLGTALASRYVWAGASATTVELMTVADFATNHSAAYAELPVDCYTVEYNANNAAGTMSNSVFAVGKEVTLKKNAFTALGYTFKGWTTNGTDVVYADEATGIDFATTNATLTLTAKWELDSNGVTAEDFTSLTNMLATAKNQSTSLGVTIGFDSGVTIPAGETVTLPDVGTTGFEGLKYEDSTKMWLEDGVLYADKLRGNVTVDALQLMKLANGGTTPTSFKVITEGEGTSVTNDVIMLLGSDRQQYCNDEDDVAQMIDAVLAASPRPETVTIFDVKETIVSFTDFTDGKDGVYEVDEGETAKIAIAGGSMANAVEATLYCVSMSSGAIKTTGGKFARNLIYVDGKRVNFPITLKWEKGDAEPKIVEIVTVANKAVKPDRYVRLQLGAPVGCKIVAGSDYAQLTIKDGGPDPRREVTASIYPAHAGKVSGMGFLKNEKSVITLTAKPASFAKTSTFKGWFKAGEDGSIDYNAPVSTELKLKVGYEDAGRYIAYFEDVLALPQAVAPEVFKDGQIAQGVEGVAPMDKDNSMLMLLAGAKVSLPINFSEETTGVTGVTAKGLPNGLKVAFDKKTGTCVITGKPTAKIGHYTSTLTVKNAAGKSTTTINFVVYSLKGRAVGLGIAEGMPNSNIDMTIGSSGSVSAKINVAGVYNFSFSAKNLNYTCDSDLNPIITIDLTNSKLEQELKLTWNSEEAAFEGEFMGSKFTAILLDSGSKTVGTYTDKIFDSDAIQIGTMKVVVKESGLATITGKIDGQTFSTFGYAEEGDGKAYAYKTEFFTGTTKYYFFGDDVRLYDDCVYEILGHGGYQGGEISDEVSFSEPLLPPQ